jgi:hypothetical protein
MEAPELQVFKELMELPEPLVLLEVKGLLGQREFKVIKAQQVLLELQALMELQAQLEQPD